MGSVGDGLGTLAYSVACEVSVIVKKHGKHVLYTSDGKRVLGVHDTEAEAKAQEAAINISKARAAGHRIPYKK